MAEKTARPRPREIRHLRDEGLVRITWSDEHVSAYPLTYLRGWCPCAACQGHGGERRFLDLPEAQLERIEPVGSYAVILAWVGGHDTGIYSYDYLWQICPCSVCAEGRRQGTEP